MDVKTVFLNNNLEKEIYIDQLEGFIAKGQENKVCTLLKSLYGLNKHLNNDTKDNKVIEHLNLTSMTMRNAFISRTLIMITSFFAYM